MRKNGRTDRRTDMTKLIFAFRNFANGPKARQGSCARFFKDLLKNCDNYDDNNHIVQCFPNSLLTTPFWLRKITTDPHISDLINRVPRWCVSKIRFILRAYFGWILIRIITYALHDLSIIKMIVARFLCTGRFLFRYSNGHTK